MFSSSHILTIERWVRSLDRDFDLNNVKLRWNRREVKRGSLVAVGEPVELVHGDRMKVALPFNDKGVKSYILFDDLSPANQQQVRGMFPGHGLFSRD